MMERCRSLLITLALCLFAMPGTAHAANMQLAGTLASLQRDVDVALGQYRACSDFPCPDVNCQSHHAAKVRLSVLAELLGDPRIMTGQSDPVQLGAQRKTLAYWIDRQRAATTVHYQNLLNTYATNDASAKTIEAHADVQRWLILISKTAQIAGDVAGLAERMSGLLAANPATLDWVEYVKVADSIAVGTTSMIEAAEAADTFANRIAGQDPRVKTPPGLADVMTKAQAGRETVVAAGALRDLKQALGALRAEEEAVRRSGAANFQSLASKREALLTATRAAKFSGLNLASKILTITADSQQAEMRERLAELKKNLPKEAQVLLAATEELDAASDAWQNLAALTASIREAQRALGACDAACEAQAIPPRPPVPVAQFVNVEQNSESYGDALRWFEATLASLQQQAVPGDLEIKDGKVSLEARPPQTAIGEAITIAYSGSRCLLRSGKIGDLQSSVRTEAGGGSAVLPGKPTAGDYTFSFTPTGYRAGAHANRYRTDVVVRVGKSPLIGYWQRSGTAQIRNGKGEVVDWPEAPAGLLVGEAKAGGPRAVHLWPRMKADAFAAYFSIPKLTCEGSDKAVSCRFEERQDACGLQWHSYRFELLDSGAGRLSVDGGEMPSRGVNGCVVWPHVFLPMNYELRRAAADSPLIRNYPCPPDVRCR